MPSEDIDAIRLKIAGVLDAIAVDSKWSEELYAEFCSLSKLTNDDGLLAHAQEELGHYYGALNARNLLLFRVNPDKYQVESLKQEFICIARAIRDGVSWEEYKRVNRIYEGSDIRNAIGRLFSRIRRP